MIYVLIRFFTKRDFNKDELNLSIIIIGKIKQGKIAIEMKAP
jgi:hypothetical protein